MQAKAKLWNMKIEIRNSNLMPMAEHIIAKERFSALPEILFKL